MLEPSKQLVGALTLLLIHLLSNLADYLLLLGIVLIGTFLFLALGINFLILYAGIVCIGSSIILGFTAKPKPNNGRKF